MPGVQASCACEGGFQVAALTGLKDAQALLLRVALCSWEWGHFIRDWPWSQWTEQEDLPSPNVDVYHSDG